jgi:mannose-6-phosphate isomerase-like protein (cupin superfamily)
MRAFNLPDLLADQADAGKRYLEFLRVDSLSVGVYRLRAGEPDPQQPHGQDEVYYVIAGCSRFTAGGETVEVAPGSVLFVEHRFTKITEDLTVLVFFALAEGATSPR